MTPHKEPGTVSHPFYSKLFVWLWLTVLLAAVLRLASPLLPGMWLWGVNQLRFLPPWCWVASLASLLLLIPAVARPLADQVEKTLGHDALSRLQLPLAVGAGGLVVLLVPDRVFFIGDFLLRLRSAELGARPAELFPQSLPLDLWLHFTVPNWLRLHGIMEPAVANRVVGAVNAGILAALALMFADQLGTRGLVRWASAAMVWFGGWLALFTGFAKGYAEVSWMLLAAVVLGIDTVRGRRPFLLFALLVAVALWFHRSAIGLLPALVLLAILHLKGPNQSQSDGSRVWQLFLAAAVVAMTLVVLWPQLLTPMVKYDVTHFAAEKGAGSMVITVLAPLRLLDGVNLILLLVPLAPLSLFFFLPARMGSLDRREWWWLLTLIVPYLVLLFMFTPAQGRFRDIDPFAVSGVAVAVLIAVVVASALRSSRGSAWLALGVIAGAAVPAIGGLLLHNDLERGFRRIESWVTGPPVRSDELRVRTLDFVGSRLYLENDFAGSARVFAQAAELAPSPRMLSSWGESARRAGKPVEAEHAYRLLLERVSAEDTKMWLVGHLELASIVGERGDLDGARGHLEEVLKIDPDHPDALRLMRLVEDGQARR